MGMFTEIMFRATVHKDSEAIPVLNHLFNDGPEPKQLPDHPFFKSPRWGSIGHSYSFYHHPNAVNSWVAKNDCVYIFSRSDMKNYDGEIQKFFDWVMPYVAEEPREYLGHILYEEDALPLPVNAGDQMEW